MKPITNCFLLANAVGFLSYSALAQQVRDMALDDHTVYSVPVSAAHVTTVSFPSPIAAIDGALTTTDGKTPGAFQIAHTKDTAYFSVRALVKEASTNVNVRWNNRTYVFELKESTEPCYSLVLRAAEKAPFAPRPLTPNRLLGILDKAKAFPLLQQYQPDAVHDVEYRDCRAKPLVSDCGSYEVKCIEAFRFPAQDTLVFQLNVANKTAKPIEHAPEQLEVRVGDQTYTASVADIPGIIPPQSAATGYVAITGDVNGKRNGLSLKNDFSFVLSRRIADIEAATRAFERMQTEGFTK